MHFITYDHYPVLENEIIFVQNICFICLDDNLCDTIHPLKYYNYRLALCECNMYIHHACLREWYLHKNECPLCRQQSSLILDHPIVHNPLVPSSVWLRAWLGVVFVTCLVHKWPQYAYYIYVFIAVTVLDSIIHPMYYYNSPPYNSPQVL